MFILTWRPLQLTSAQNMNMQMVNALGSVFTIIDNKPEAGLIESSLMCYFTGGNEEVPWERNQKMYLHLHLLQD